MIIGIPSYKRAGRVKTLDFLGGAFNKDEIIISTQTESDLDEYSKLYGNSATIICREAHSAGEARNNLLDYAEENGLKEILFLDDDISFVQTMNRKKLNGQNFRELMESCFSICREKNVVLFGGYPVANHFFMSNTAKRNIINGMLFALLDVTYRFDTYFTTKEDYELSLRIMRQGKRVIRFNSFGAQADYKTKGGCEEIRENKEKYYFLAKLLVDAYPNLVKLNKEKKGEIKFIG